MKNIIILFYKILKMINNISEKIFKKEFLLFIKNLIEKDSYKKIEIFGRKVALFTPNQLCSWRVNTFFLKNQKL